MPETGPRPYEILQYDSRHGKRYYTVTRGGRLILRTRDLRQVEYYQQANAQARAGSLASTGKTDGG